jgi:hypothetical protein
LHSFWTINFFLTCGLFQVNAELQDADATLQKLENRIREEERLDKFVRNSLSFVFLLSTSGMHIDVVSRECQMEDMDKIRETAEARAKQAGPV